MAQDTEDSSKLSNNHIGILVGGGPAPGINGVISALTLEARSRAHRVIGIYDGFQWLIRGDTSHVKEIDHDDVSRIHFQGGSILNTSRANPTKKTEDLQKVIASLDALKIGYLATIESASVTYRRPSTMISRFREKFPRSASRPPGNGVSSWYKT
jgi:6-phosphofructokinase 1